MAPIMIELEEEFFPILDVVTGASLAVPADQERPFVMDMATSTVPRGKLEVYHRAEKPLPSVNSIAGGATMRHRPSRAQRALLIFAALELAGGPGHTENDDPQPQVVVAFGLRITNWAPCKSSL